MKDIHTLFLFSLLVALSMKASEKLDKKQMLSLIKQQKEVIDKQNKKIEAFVSQNKKALLVSKIKRVTRRIIDEKRLEIKKKQSSERCKQAIMFRLLIWAFHNAEIIKKFKFRRMVRKQMFEDLNRR